MSKTIVDMPKVCQMLDAGWHIFMFKGDMGGYEVRAQHDSEKKIAAVKTALITDKKSNCQDFLRSSKMTAGQAVDEFDFDDDSLMTNDFTPEQALTRMAYKVFGEIL